MSELGGQTGADPATITASTSLAGPRPLLLRPTLSLFRRRTTTSRKPISASDPLSSPYTALRPLLTHDLAIATLAASASTPPASASEERSSTETHSEVVIVTPPLSEDVHAVPTVDIFGDESCDGLSAHPGRWPTLDDEPGQLVERRSSAGGKSGVTAGSGHTTYEREKVLGSRADIKAGHVDVTALVDVEDDTVFVRLVEERVTAGRIPNSHVRILFSIRQLLQTETSYNRHLRSALEVRSSPRAGLLAANASFPDRRAPRRARCPRSAPPDRSTGDAVDAVSVSLRGG